jgi:ParB family chromosome partitioning protein
MTLRRAEHDQRKDKIMPKAPQAFGPEARGSYSYEVPAAHLFITGVDGDEAHLADSRIKLPIDDALVESINENGVVTPVSIQLRNGKAYVVDGRRRVLHARVVEQKYKKRVMIPTHVQEGTDADMEAIAIMSNALRVQDGPVAEAQKAKRALASKKEGGIGMTEEDVLKSFGWSKATLKNRLTLLELAPRVLKHVIDGKLSPIAALQLATLEHDEQEKAADELVALSKPGQQHAGQIKQAKSAKDKAKGGEGHMKPTKSLIKKLLETDAAEQLDADVVRVLKWMIGEGSHTKIAGLAACLNAVYDRAAERAEARKQKFLEKKAEEKKAKKPPPRVETKKTKTAAANTAN